MLKALLFDLDETLYRPRTGMLSAGDRAITGFIARRFDIGWQRADQIRADLWQRYGTTAAGLEREHGIPQQEFYTATIETVDAAEYVKADPALADMLSAISIPLHVFTNSTEPYAHRVLDTLGVREHFVSVLDISSRNWHPKPQPEAYEAIAGTLDCEPAELGFIEDHIPNIIPARRLGWTVFLMRETHPAAHYVLKDILDLGEVLREERLCEVG
jgi:putative hydrolase of the HAD superfamily